MSTSRTNPFSDLESLPSFEPKPKTPRPVVNDQIEKIAETHGFPSRQATKSLAPKTKSIRRYRTGRNQQINIKTTAQVIERLYKLADERRIPLGQLLEQAVDALERTIS